MANDTPRWLIAVIITLMLPMLAFPALLSQTPEEYSTMLWLYPIYTLATGWLSYKCLGAMREIAYILLALLALSHVAIWFLPYANQ